MFVAADDTDSMRGNCTTYLATEIIRELAVDGDLDLIGYPRLVRLNPAVPWKTRGNGALAMRFGKGSGEKTFIGKIDGKDLYCYKCQTGGEPDSKELVKRIRPLVEEYHDPVDSDPGIVITSVRPDPSFYRRGVTRVLKRSEIEDEIQRIGAEKIELGCGRGVIGATCALAWEPGDHTYELLSYRPRSRWGTERVYDPSTVARAEHEISTSFNSWDDRLAQCAMVPGTPCPVMYGFRGDVPADLIRGHEIIKTEPLSRWVVFETNQGTDDHIIRYPAPEEFIPNSSYLVKGTVVSSERIRGGHTFLTLDTQYGKLDCAAYAPSGPFRWLLDWLDPGDEIEAMGELRDSPRTLNLEKVHVVSLADEWEKVSNPVCPNCGTTMSSAGKGQGYRCRKCGARSKEAVMRKAVRPVVPGWYEPPVEARRHLSKPLKRMGIVQPVEFVDCRNR
ncbi:MAG: TiaS agmantine-binding domain-containing protein [Methanomethylophilus sp.]|jgi:tRNA(Ile2)-agmatinylcytidine synthase